MTEPTNISSRRVNFDLDAYEPAPHEVADPFVVRIAGREVEFADPKNLDWRVVAQLGTPQGLLAHVLSDEDREFLDNQQNITARKFGEITRRYLEHFKIEVNRPSQF